MKTLVLALFSALTMSTAVSAQTTMEHDAAELHVNHWYFWQVKPHTAETSTITRERLAAMPQLQQPAPSIDTSTMSIKLIHGDIVSPHVSEVTKITPERMSQMPQLPQN